MIDRSTVDRIFSAADIVEIVNDFVTLKKKGTNYQACCPFHNEKTPSFVVSPAKGLFKCFGCGKGGNAITFLMEHEKMEYVDALRYVAAKYGIAIEEKEQTEDQRRQNDDRESMMTVTSFANQFFIDTLHNSDEGKSIGISYFRERGFSDAIIRKFQLGYCPEYGSKLAETALKEGYKQDFLTRTGLCGVRDNGTPYDRFYGRVMFPVHSLSGRVIAFGGRTLKTDKKVSKYVNSPESEIYHKGSTLYGIFFAKKSITSEDRAILVEGYTDVLSMHQAGIENVVASSGTSLTEEQIKLLRRFTHNITVLYDGDAAGIKASLRGIDMLLKEGLNVRVVLLPDGEDPDSFARKNNATSLRDYVLEHEQDFLKFKTQLLLDDAKNDPIKKAALITDIVTSISQIPDAIARSVYTKECSQLLDVAEDLLLNEIVRKRIGQIDGEAGREVLRNREIKERVIERQATVSPHEGLYTLERELLSYLLKYGNTSFEFYQPGSSTSVELNVATTIIGELEADNISFLHPLYKIILVDYVALKQEAGEVSIHSLINSPDPEICDMVVSILTQEDIYKPSKLWEKHEIYVSTEQERLNIAIPKAITTYKSKLIGSFVDELKLEFSKPEQSDDQTLDVFRKIDALNQMRKNICEKYARII